MMRATASGWTANCSPWPARATPARTFHIDGVRRILAGAGLTPDDLQCTARPADARAEPADLLAAGAQPPPLYMNCSGKHAAMLATCARATVGRP